MVGKMETTSGKTIPQYFLDKGINHFSPTQASYPLDVWLYKYWHCDKQKRDNFKKSSKMRCGTLAGDSVAADITRNVRPLFHYDGYKDWDDFEDQKQWENDKENINATIEQIFLGLKDVGVKWDDKRTKIVFEYPVSMQDPRLVVPIHGYTDIQTPTLLIELKTTWSSNRIVGKKKDWTPEKGWTYSYKELPTKPNENHLQQASFYYFATKIPTVIIQANAKNYVPFYVKDYDYKEAYNNLVISCMRKQEAAKLQNPFQVIEPKFEDFGRLKFWWDIGDKYLNEAKELYGY
tara:strand:+ start:965 stop:1837 length:873 start_codon:yes stop_codon:yes gene_type:complete